MGKTRKLNGNHEPLEVLTNLDEEGNLIINETLEPEDGEENTDSSDENVNENKE